MFKNNKNFYFGGDEKSLTTRKRLVITIVICGLLLVVGGITCWCLLQFNQGSEGNDVAAVDVTVPSDVFDVSDIEFVPEETEEEVVEEEAPVEEATVAYEEPVYYNYAPAPEATYSEPVAENGSGLTKSGGINWHNGRKETWYSSNVLYHHKTGEWTAGADGVYRDADGYVVVAASDLTQGSVVDTSFGAGKVYDSGCAAGVTDIYCNW